MYQKVEVGKNFWTHQQKKKDDDDFSYFPCWRLLWKQSMWSIQVLEKLKHFSILDSVIFTSLKRVYCYNFRFSEFSLQRHNFSFSISSNFSKGSWAFDSSRYSTAFDCGSSRILFERGWNRVIQTTQRLECCTVSSFFRMNLEN